jgi:hypothetical protein
MRDARVIETTRAGEFAMLIVGHGELERLLLVGKISQEQFGAGQRLAELWYSSGLPGFGASWHADGRTMVWGGGRLEKMSERQEGCWRAYSTALRSLPLKCRTEIERVVLNDEEPKSLCALRYGLSLLEKGW